MNKDTLNENNKANIYDCIYDTNCKISKHILAVKILNNKNINDKTYNTFANIETLDNLTKEYENDFEKAAKFIMKNVLNNYEFYIKLRKCEADECSIGDLLLIYILIMIVISEIYIIYQIIIMLNKLK